MTMSQEKQKVRDLHWLVRPRTIKNLWRSGLFLLVVLLFTDFLITPHPYFSIDGTFGFYAWYGFFSCALMVIGAKAFGLLVKRNDTYYEDKNKTGDNNA
jgi:hypothetical protein